MSDDIKDLSDTITPNGDQLNADDLISGDLIITITKFVRVEDKKQPWKIFYKEGDEKRPYKPNLTMRKIIFNLWGKDGTKFAGRKIKLFRDPEVMYGSEKTGGIVISHLSHIDKPESLLLQTKRGKRKLYNIGVLESESESYPQASFDANVANWVSSIMAGKLTIGALKKKAEASGTEFTEAQIKELETRIGEK